MSVFQLTMRGFARHSALLGSLLGAAIVLQADALPYDYTVAETYLYDSNANSICSQAADLTASCSSGGSSANATVNNGYGGLASVSIGNSASTGLAVTAYVFGLFGPKTEDVPILINGVANTSDGNTTDSFGYAWYYNYQYTNTGFKWTDDFFASPNACAYLADEDIPCHSSGNFTLNSTVQSNSAFVVFLEAVATGQNSSAMIDPTITIDPSFADASQFTLVASQGVFAIAPEPTYVPVLALVGLAGFVLQRQRRQSKAKQATILPQSA